MVCVYRHGSYVRRVFIFWYHIFEGMNLLILLYNLLIIHQKFDTTYIFLTKCITATYICVDNTNHFLVIVIVCLVYHNLVIVIVN